MVEGAVLQAHGGLDTGEVQVGRKFMKEFLVKRRSSPCLGRLLSRPFYRLKPRTWRGGQEML
jgi:hypothetical protein